MEACQPILNTGLRGFKVATTNISDVDGTAGRLIYRGYLVQDLAGEVSFEEVAYLLYMLNGTIPDDELAGFFDTCLVLHAEHSFNASTFSARQVASTRAHMYSAVAAGVGSLAGELHGGANTRVMEMLLDIETVDRVEAYVNNLLDTGGKIMGLGHAVYKTDDPRAHILAPMSKKMGELTGKPKWYEISEVLEKKGKEAFKQRKFNKHGCFELDN